MFLLSITDWWASLTQVSQIFWAIALIGTVLFIIQIILALIGIEYSVEADVDVGDGLGLISFRSLLTFFTFFGWGGVAALAEGFSGPKAAMVGFLCGFLAMVGLAYLFAKLYKMQESGTVDIYDAVSKHAEVYLSIPADHGGRGKVHVEIANKVMELDATSRGQSIPTGASVKVIDVLSDNVLLVDPI